MEIVRLEAIDDRRRFADRAVLEANERRRARVVFVRGENRMAALRRVARHFLGLAAHAQQQRVERMAAGGEQRAATERFFRVPAILAVPRADAVIVIDFAVVQRADEARVNHRFGRDELRRPAALETEAHFDTALLRGPLHCKDFGPLDRERLLHDDVFSVLRRGDELLRVLVGVARDIDRMNVRAREHGGEIGERSNRRAVARGKLGVIELARRPDGGDLRLAGRVDRRDVRGRRPAVADDGDVVFLHELIVEG